MNWPMGEDIVEPGEEVYHGWFVVSFVHESHIECECGFRPFSQEDMDGHI